MKILMLGDIYSTDGRRMVEQYYPNIKKEHKIDILIANGENVSHGKGISWLHYKFLCDNGVDIITSGNHIFRNKEVYDFIDDVDNLLRPENMGPYVPGRGSLVFEHNNKKIRVTNLIGRSFMEPAENPYWALENILHSDDSDIHLIDFHAEATAEKIALFNYFDGQISALVGTHTHVQTADEYISPRGSAYITDLGMTGCYESIIGGQREQIIFKERTGMPARFEPATGLSQICGVILEFNDSDNSIKSIERIFIKE